MLTVTCDDTLNYEIIFYMIENIVSPPFWRKKYILEKKVHFEEKSTLKKKAPFIEEIYF